MLEEKNTPKRPHHLVIEDRQKMTLSAVRDVDSFDEQTISLFTDYGRMVIKGDGLHIQNLSTETGDMLIEGNIRALMYTDDMKATGGWFSKLFR